MRWYDPLRRQSDIAQVRRRGRRTRTATLAAYGLDAKTGRPRIGVTVSKAVGSAVTRNLVRRRIRGALDALEPRPPFGRILIVAQPQAALESYARLAADVTNAVRRVAGPP